jgi:hypothetical protein
MNNIIVHINMEEFHKRVKTLTGDTWCPYPSGRFVWIVMRTTDEIAKALIEARKEFTFPDFLGKEPMQKTLSYFICPWDEDFDLSAIP